MSKWGQVKGTFGRAHNQFGFPTAEFLNYNETGITKGNVVGEYQSIGTLDVEFVPPSSDSTVDEQGTHLGFSTSIRVPEPDLSELDAEETLTVSGEYNVSGSESYTTVVVESGGSLLIPRGSELIVESIVINGTVFGDGELTTVATVTPTESVIQYGANDQKPTAVDVRGERYEITASIPEDGSDMRLLRLVEQ